MLEVLSDEEGVILCEPLQQGQFRRGSTADYRAPKGEPATVEAVDDNTLKLMNTGRKHYEAPTTKEKPEFRDFLNSWGGEWMWKGLRMNESPEWVADCLRRNTLVCVTDAVRTTRKRRLTSAALAGH